MSAVELASSLPWVQRCLSETGWGSWHPHHILGEGARSMAVLVQRSARQAALLLDRPNRPMFNKPGYDSLSLYQSASAIRLACRRAGLPVARTMGAPRAWSGGAAVLLSRVPGRDLEHMLGDPSLDGFAIGTRVAQMVAASQVLGTSHKRHTHGFGAHLFGHQPPRTSSLEVWSEYIDPLRHHERVTDALIDRLQSLAQSMLSTAPRTTQIWDVGDRNIMLDTAGQVVGLVDQVDMFTGDPMLVPGFSLAMLGNVHGWHQVDRYATGWRAAWDLDQEQWCRVHLHRLTCYGRFMGRRWNTRPPALTQWQSEVRQLLSGG